MERLFGRSCLLDTNVLAYALDEDSRYFAQASDLVASCVAGRVLGYVAHQNLLELFHALTAYYRVPAPQALADVFALAHQPGLSVICPSSGVLSEFLRLARMRMGASFDAFDLYLAATMKLNGLSRLVTANVRDFARIPDLEVIDLATLVV